MSCSKTQLSDVGEAEPTTPLSRVKHCPTEPLRSHHSYADQTQTGPQIRVCNQNLFSYFSTKTYVVGTEKNRFIETALFNIQNNH